MCPAGRLLGGVEGDGEVTDRNRALPAWLWLRLPFLAAVLTPPLVFWQARTRSCAARGGRVTQRGDKI